MAERGGREWVRYGLPGLALGLVLAWGSGSRGPSALAQGPGGGVIPMPNPASERVKPAAGAAESSAVAGGMIALTAPAGGSAQLLYLIDTRSRAFAIYRVDPANSKGTVKLEAARQYQWDLKLTEYNNQAPEVSAVESTVKSLGQPSTR